MQSCTGFGNFTPVFTAVPHAEFRGVTWDDLLAAADLVLTPTDQEHITKELYLLFWRLSYAHLHFPGAK